MTNSKHTHRFSPTRLLIVGLMLLGFASFIVVTNPSNALAAGACPKNYTNAGGKFKVNEQTDTAPKYCCGSGANAVAVSINFGCKGADCTSSDPNGCNALVDITFAIIRFLSIGVGMVVVASIVWAGIQYTSSRGDPSKVAAARERIQNTLIALLVYIFAAAMLNYVLPQGFLKL